MRAREEDGSVAVEVAVVAPALVVLLLLVVFAGRMSQAEADVRRAASEAARAASLRQDAGAAVAAAEATASANLTTSGVACAHQETVVDTDEFAAGGRVAVTVRCDASLADVTLLGVPGERRFEARSVEVIDRYRSAST